MANTTRQDGYTTHGHPCCDLAASTPIFVTEPCGGPDTCDKCLTEVIGFHNPNLIRDIQPTTPAPVRRATHQHRRDAGSGPFENVSGTAPVSPLPAEPVSLVPQVTPCSCGVVSGASGGRSRGPEPVEVTGSDPRWSAILAVVGTLPEVHRDAVGDALCEARCRPPEQDAPATCKCPATGAHLPGCQATHGHPCCDVLAEIAAERGRQDAKWGEQNHPDLTGPTHGLVLATRGWSKTYPQVADDLRHNTQQAAARGEVAWAHILLEEVFEALAEDDPAKLRAELVQVAAVTVAWIEAIDRREASADA